MADKPIYEELEQRVKELEKEALGRSKVEKDLRIFKTAFESSINAFGITDLEGKLIYVNDSCVKMWGYNSKDEILERFLPEFWEGDGFLKTVKELREKGVASGEDVGKRKDGSLFYVRFTASMFKDEADNPSFMFGSFFDITEPKQAEGALRESEERYRSLFKNNHSVMLLIDPESADIIDANTAAVSFYGWSFEALTGKKVTDINTLSDEQVFQEIRKAKTEQRLAFYFQHRLANGEIRDVEVFSGPIKVYDRELLYSIVHDISKRKRAEEAVRDSEEKYRLLMNNIPGIVYKGFKDWSVEFYDNKIERFTGYNIQKFNSGRTKWIDLIVKDDIEPAREIFIRALKTDKSYVRDYRIKTKSKDILWIKERGQIVCDDKGKIKYVSGVFFDITETKKAERALRKSEEKYHRMYKLMRLMTDNMPDMIWAKDMDGRYMFVNQAMCDNLIMCDCPDRAIGMTDMFITEQERNAGYEHTFNEIGVNSDAIIKERKAAYRVLEEGLVRNKYLVLDVYKAPFLNENGDIIGTVGCGRDVTNEKKVEKALKEREIELERKNLRLEELNSALKIILEKRDEDKKVLEEKVLTNMKELVLPYVEKLKTAGLNDRQEIFLEIIQSNIEDILSPFAYKLSYKYLSFTPTELQVADLVKQGLRTKEIAHLLNSSPETVSGHRKSMRKKLNLKDKKSNLRTHLLSLGNG